MAVHNYYEVSDNSIKRLRQSCPRCGDGFFLADHKLHIFFTLILLFSIVSSGNTGHIRTGHVYDNLFVISSATYRSVMMRLLPLVPFPVKLAFINFNADSFSRVS